MAAKGNRHERLTWRSTRLGDGRDRPGFMFAHETGLRLDPRNCLEPDFIVYATTNDLAAVTGPDILLVVEVADSSPDYDLRRKPLAYAALGIQELWVIDALRPAVHWHEDAENTGYASIDTSDATAFLVPRRAPKAFALRFEDLEDL